MRSVVTTEFRRNFSKLPGHLQNAARKAYQLWKHDPSYPSLKFKKIHETKPIYSARITGSYRAVCIKEEDVFIWFWVGTHSEYDVLLKNL